MVPPKEVLQPYVNNRKEAARVFNVTERTIINWLKKHNLYSPRENYGCGKLNQNKADEIRKLYKDGVTIKELAVRYGVTFSSIARVIHNLTYQESRDVAIVSVVHNINSSQE